MYGDTLNLTPYQRRKRAESAYRLHIVYGFTWQEVAEGGYPTANAAKHSATRVAHSALAMFYDIPNWRRRASKERSMVHLSREARSNSGRKHAEMRRK